ncbi:GAF domain-containing protein [Planktothricoides sp. FACHB-1370]|uniref:histidine kinase n=3 Tax=Planktothricoides raciborskii TaxID=132608 RepID=A0ABR8EE33_9CYAN|nr:ATP-binding protein [Planktothricoides sp. SR001]KOR36252.1 hypothetical protein AM228_13560 [Planktothricoides sp. SR001]MBD2544840.1 GAF domain-containing protein [Planktothricoides raciborskii FACHB-1370]MBD2583064.1 GAF domain-containing protein [Planktothricoides raciborskii FACHB-1261]
MLYHSSHLSTMHLLIVQPEMSDIQLIVDVLRNAQKDFTYDFANNPETCRILLATVQYDAVLSAYQMSNFTGLDICKWQEELNQVIPMILIAGSIGESTVAHCIKSGFSDYINRQQIEKLPEVLQRSLVEFALRRQDKIALEHMRYSAKREAIINQIVYEMRGTLVLEEVLQTTVDLLHQALNVSRCLVFLLDPQHKPQVRYASHATPDREQVIGKHCYLLEYYHTTLSRGNPVFVSNIDQADLPPNILSKANEDGIRGFLIAPLLNQEVYWGNICLHQCDRHREWTGDDLILMSTISNQCAIAIQQAKLFEKIQQQAQQEQLLNEIIREINSQLDPNYILSQIVRQTGEYFQGNRVVIFSMKNQRVQVVHEWRSSENVSSLLGFHAPLSEWKEPLGYFASQSGYFLADLNQERVGYGSSWEQQLDRGNIVSLLRVPIYIREEFFGAISIHSTTKNRFFEPDEIHLLERIADQTAIALYNAQSYERLEQLVKKRTLELEQEKILSEAANRTKTEFLNNMSHELRTPLTGILGFSNVLIQEFFGPLNEKQKQYISSITECGEQLLNLINDLLDISKLEAKEENLHPQALLVEEICGACLSLIQERVKNEGLELRKEIAPDARFCVGDSRRIKQILFNLLSNAIKFTHAGSVTLKVWQNEDKICFSVIDTGIGIPEAEQALIFEPFHQLDQGLSRKYEGTGLGLALSQKLAQMHGGDITLESEVGRGSCFTFWLPLNHDLMQTECPIKAWENIKSGG